MNGSLVGNRHRPPQEEKVYQTGTQVEGLVHPFTCESKGLRYLKHWIGSKHSCVVFLAVSLSGKANKLSIQQSCAQALVHEQNQ